MDKYTRYLKRLAKKAGVPTKEIREVWDTEMEVMVSEGLDRKDPLFIQDLASRVKRAFEINEDFIALDKFKKFL